MLVPDSAAVATDRSSVCVTLVNDEYRRFAERYGATVAPARVRRLREKAVAEPAVDLVEKWAIALSVEMTFYMLEEFSEFCLEWVCWLNACLFSGRYEMCEWLSYKVAPDYHITVDYMRHSITFRLIGGQVDVRLSDTRVTVMSGGEAVAGHDGHAGAGGQYSTPA